MIAKASPDAATNKKRPRRTRGRLSLTTNSKDYAGTLDLPEQVCQRKYESTGQFIARLNRLVTKAKEEASMEAKFDMKLSENNQAKLKTQARDDAANAKPSKTKKRRHNKRKNNRTGISSE